jgi:hypothetical protein
VKAPRCISRWLVRSVWRHANEQEKQQLRDVAIHALREQHPELDEITATAQIDLRLHELEW